ncbi:protein L [Pseudomonas farris]
MALAAEHTTQYLQSISKPTEIHWTHVFDIGEEVPVSGIYRCFFCSDEITSNKGDKFPPQNKTQHECDSKPVQWQLVVMTQTKGPNT